MTILRYNSKDVILAPDLSVPLSTEKSERIQGDLQVVEQTSDLLALVNTRIDALVQRMNDFESGAGSEWAVPLQNEKNERIAGDLENKNLTNGLNTAMTNRVNGLFDDIVAVEDRVTVLEQDDTTIVRQGDTATLEQLTVNRDITGQTASFTNQVTVGSLNNLSDHPWTKIQDGGDNLGVWFKRQGDMISVRVKIYTGAAVSNNKICDIPSWAQLPGNVAYMFVISPWATTASPAYQLQVHGNKADDPNKNIIEILRSPATTNFEFTVNYSVGNMPS